MLQVKTVVRSNERENRKLTVPLGKGLVGTAALLNEPVRVADVSKDPRYISVHPDEPSWFWALLWDGDVLELIVELCFGIFLGF